MTANLPPLRVPPFPSSLRRSSLPKSSTAARSLAWNDSMATEASARLQGLLLSVCSSSDNPLIPASGLLTAVAEKRFLVNAVVQKGVFAPGLFVNAALSTWANGKGDYQVRGGEEEVVVGVKGAFTPSYSSGKFLLPPFFLLLPFPPSFPPSLLRLLSPLPCPIVQRQNAVH